MRVGTHFSKSVALASPLARVHAFLADVPKQTRELFPGIRAVEVMEGECLRWQFKRLDVKGLSLEIECFTRIEVTPNRISALPVSGRGNAVLSIQWILEPGDHGCRLTLEADFGLEMNIPIWLKPLAAPFAESELSKLFERYLSEVTRHAKNALQ